MQDERYFRTSSWNTALFLFVKGEMELADIDKISNPKRATFIFLDRPNREELLHAFEYGKEGDPTVMVDARKMILATRQLKEKLYADRF